MTYDDSDEAKMSTDAAQHLPLLLNEATAFWVHAERDCGKGKASFSAGRR